MIDLETSWRQGKVWSIRRLPRHVHLDVPIDWSEWLRVGCWLVVRSVAVAVAVVALLVMVAEAGK